MAYLDDWYAVATRNIAKYASANKRFFHKG
jgi:hypothetical protein